MALNIATTSIRFPYIYRGIVKDINDPKSMGRVRIHVPDIHGIFNYPVDSLPWARPIMNGQIAIPDLESVVYVFYEDGDKMAPIYLSGVITTKDGDISSDEIIIFKNDTASIIYNKTNKTLTLTSGDPQAKVILGSEKEKSYIDMTADELRFNGESGGGGGIGGYDYFVIKEI